MGCFGYLCSVCDKQIVGNCFHGGEECVLIHKRHGVEIGRAIGHYDEYGKVLEDETFRNDEEGNPNSHSEICDSEMSFSDSHSFDGLLFVDGETIRKGDVKRVFINQIRREMAHAIYHETGVFETIDSSEIEENWEERGYNERFIKFVLDAEVVKSESGIVASHKYCYDNLSNDEKKNLRISDADPDQSWGEINPLYK